MRYSFPSLPITKSIGALNQTTRVALTAKKGPTGSSAEIFVLKFTTLFGHYRHALTLESVGQNGAKLRQLSDLTIVELNRMVSAARELERQLSASDPDASLEEAPC